MHNQTTISTATTVIQYQSPPTNTTEHLSHGNLTSGHVLKSTSLTGSNRTYPQVTINATSMNPMHEITVYIKSSSYTMCTPVTLLVM